MCYAIPGKVEALLGKTAVIDYFGKKKKALNELHELSVGDYVYAQGGYVIQKVLPKEAQEILSSWHELFLELNEVDLRDSRPPALSLSSDRPLLRILDKACAGSRLSDEELHSLLRLKEPADIELLSGAANFLRQKYHQNACCVHGIIEITNQCVRNCAYCGISAHNTVLPRYRMSKSEVLSCVEEAVERYGFKAVMLQSGEGNAYSTEELAEIIRAIKERYPVLVLVSFGEIGEVGMSRLFAAGARGLLMRFETSNPELYRRLHPGFELQKRLEEIRSAYRMGFLIITGALVGLPGQVAQDIINDLRLAAELNAEMFSFGPFLPHPNSPLCAQSAPGEEDLLKVLALSRLIAPADTKILVTTAFETLSPLARQKGLRCGANSLMVNLTPLTYRPLYSIYPFKAHERENTDVQVAETMKLLKSLGRIPIDLGISRISGA